MNFGYAIDYRGRHFVCRILSTNAGDGWIKVQFSDGGTAMWDPKLIKHASDALRGQAMTEFHEECESIRREYQRGRMAEIEREVCHNPPPQTEMIFETAHS